jgi:hypothetical protein
MPDTIKDGGGGAGYEARVNALNQLYIRGVTETDAQAANSAGGAYNLNTGWITLTDAADTPVAYLKNNEDQDLHVEAFAVGVDASTGGDSVFTRITVVKNPTAGTIISSPTNADIKSNRNYGSKKTLTADWYKGATGNTMTDGEDHIIFGHNDGNRLFAVISEVLPKGSSLGVKVDPPANNTSMDVYVALIVHLAEAEA